MDRDVLYRVVRTLLQMLAGGAFAQIFVSVTDLVPLQYQVLLAGVFTLLVTFAQNWLEDEGIVPKLLKPEPVTVEVVLEKEDPRVL